MRIRRLHAHFNFSTFRTLRINVCIWNEHTHIVQKLILLHHYEVNMGNINLQNDRYWFDCWLTSGSADTHSSHIILYTHIWNIVHPKQPHPEICIVSIENHSQMIHCNTIIGLIFSGLGNDWIEIRWKCESQKGIVICIAVIWMVNFSFFSIHFG